VVLGAILQTPEETKDPASASAAVKAAQAKSNFLRKPGEGAAAGNPPLPASYAGLLLPLPEFTATGAALAFFNTVPDLDGPIRH